MHRTTVTVHHPAGACKMGPATESMAVVDDKLRVRGVSSLRISARRCFPIWWVAKSTRRRS
ncbi:MAG TPA: GMC oxidoreductase [Xanthobacteraceae bacterium]